MQIFLFFNRKPLFLSVLIYILSVIVLVPFYRYQMNPDGISYISIAQKYINLDFSNAVSGYWGPLISWLLIPFLKLGIEPLLSFKLLTVIIGLVILIQSNFLIKRMEIKGRLRLLFLFIISIILIDYALFIPSPDILFLSISLVLVKVLINNSYTKFNGLLCGVLGAFLYYTKGYGLPFFIASFTVMNLLFFYRVQNKRERVKVIKTYFLGMIVFCFLSSFWVITLSSKYKEFTFATNSKYASALVAPDSPGHHPMGYMGLLKPPNNTAISVWEDISFTKVQHWNKFGSVKNILYQFKMMMRTIYFGYKMIHKFSYFGIIILLFSIVYLIEKRKNIFFEKIFILLLFFLILIGGYVFILYLEDRYIWLSSFILLIIGMKMIEYLFDRMNLNKISQLFVILIFGISFLSAPLKSLKYNFNIDKDVFELSNSIKKNDIKGNIASSGNWNKSLYLSFYNNWRYFGFSEKKVDELKKDFIENEIDYLIVWSEDKEKYAFCREYEKVSSDALDNELEIYRIN